MRRIIPALLAALVFPLLGAPAAEAGPALRFHVWVADPPGKDNRTNAHLNEERITVVNTSHRAINLSGFSIRDKAGHRYVFRSGFRLRADSSVMVHTGKGRDRRRHVYWGQGNYVWNNTGDRATLRGRHGTRLDRCVYPGPGTGGWIRC